MAELGPDGMIQTPDSVKELVAANEAADAAAQAERETRSAEQVQRTAEGAAAVGLSGLGTEVDGKPVSPWGNELSPANQNDRQRGKLVPLGGDRFMRAQNVPAPEQKSE